MRNDRVFVSGFCYANYFPDKAIDESLVCVKGCFCIHENIRLTADSIKKCSVNMFSCDEIAKVEEKIPAAYFPPSSIYEIITPIYVLTGSYCIILLFVHDAFTNTTLIPLSLPLQLS